MTDAYETVYTGGPFGVASLCLRCGALVGSTDLHDDFHRKFKALTNPAYEDGHRD